MSFSFGNKSIAALASCDVRLQRVFTEVIRHRDCVVLCGYRGQEAQEQAVREKRSRTRWPDSKHNRMPSLAADVAPYPVDWSDRERFALFAGFVLGIAASMGIKLRTGADWNGDGRTTDGWDMVHFEIVEGELA